MNVPDRVFETLRQCHRTSAWLAFSLYHAGRPMMFEGERRIYWRGSKAILAQMTGLSVMSCHRAIEELVDLDLVVVHQAVADGRGWFNGYSIVGDVEKRTKMVQIPGREAYQNGTDSSLLGGGVDLQTKNELGKDQDSPPPTLEKRTKMVDFRERLEAYGVNGAQAWLRRWGPERIEQALDALDSMPAAQFLEVRNPAGLLRQWLEGGLDLAPTPADEERPIGWVQGIPCYTAAEYAHYQERVAAVAPLQEPRPDRPTPVIRTVADLEALEAAMVERGTMVPR